MRKSADACPRRCSFVAALMFGFTILLLPSITFSQSFCPAVTNAASLDGCALPGPEWSFACTAGGSATVESTPDGNCWLVTNALPLHALCYGTRQEPTLATAPAFRFETRFRVAELASWCGCSDPTPEVPCTCSPASVGAADGVKHVGIATLRQPDGQFVGFADSPITQKWFPVDLMSAHTYRVEVERGDAGTVRYFIDDALVHSIPYSQLPLDFTGNPTVEMFADAFATTWFDFLRFDVCDEFVSPAAPGSALFQVGSITLPPTWNPSQGPVHMSATANLLTTAATDPRNRNFRYEVRYQYQIVDVANQRTLAAPGGTVPVDLSAAPRAGFQVKVPVTASWNGTDATGALALPGAYPVTLSVDAVRIHIRNGQEELLGSDSAAAVLYDLIPALSYQNQHDILITVPARPWAGHTDDDPLLRAPNVAAELVNEQDDIWVIGYHDSLGQTSFQAWDASAGAARQGFATNWTRGTLEGLQPAGHTDHCTWGGVEYTNGCAWIAGSRMVVESYPPCEGCPGAAEKYVAAYLVQIRNLGGADGVAYGTFGLAVGDDPSGDAGRWCTTWWAPFGYPVCIAWEQRLLVAYTANGGTTLMAKRLATDGSTIGGEILIASGTGIAHPRVAWLQTGDTGHWLVSYDAREVCAGPNPDWGKIHTRVVDWDGLPGVDRPHGWCGTGEVCGASLRLNKTGRCYPPTLAARAPLADGPDHFAFGEYGQTGYVLDADGVVIETPTNGTASLLTGTYASGYSFRIGGGCHAVLATDPWATFDMGVYSTFYHMVGNNVVCDAQAVALRNGFYTAAVVNAVPAEPSNLYLTLLVN
jgi:hypothetical protein